MSYLSKVNIRQGTKNTPRFSNGNTLPLTQLPFAMAGFVPQTASDRGNWFFHPEDRCLEGVRLTHQPSPWVGDYGCFCMMPQEGEARRAPEARWSGYRPEDSVYMPHYLRLDFLRYHVRMECTPTERGAALRLTYRGRETPRFSILAVKGRCGYRLHAGERLLTGYTTAHTTPVAEGFATYFAIRFDCGVRETESCLLLEDGCRAADGGEGEGAGYSVALEGRDVQVRVAVSYISAEQAVENLRQDTEGKAFEQLKSEAEAIWESYLSRIEVKAAEEEVERTFYSCLYRMFLYPHMFHERAADGRIYHYCPDTGALGEGVMYTDNGFWDTFRTVYPLFSIILPEKFAEILEGFVHIYRDCGWLPKWPSPGEAGMMPGTLIDAVIAQAAVTGCASQETLETALEGMLKHSSTAADNPRYGREGQQDYLRYGYVPRETYRECVNQTLDYAYGDFCIAQTAEALGRGEVAEAYRRRAESYRNIFDSESGFMRGRDAQGAMAENFRAIAWGGEYCEGSAWQNSFGVYHDIEGLAALHGGRGALLQKLEALFSEPPDYAVGGYSGEIHEMAEMAAVDFGQCAISNQPSFHLPYLFAVLGQPEKTAYWVEKLAREAFGSGNDGFPGDEDNGTMAGWYVFSCMGFYPVTPGTKQYVRGVPVAAEIVLHAPGGDTRIRRVGCGPYVRRVSADGRELSAQYVTHEQLAGGTELVFETTDRQAAEDCNRSQY